MRKTALLLDYAALQIDCGPYSLAEILYVTRTPYFLQQSLAGGASLWKPVAGKSKVVPTRVNAACFGRGLTEDLHALVWVPATSWIHE